MLQRHKIDSIYIRLLHYSDVILRHFQPLEALLKAEEVPHIAIQMASTMTMQSKAPHFFSMIIFADIGPITQSMNAENEPRNAIKALNSGTIIEMATADPVSRTR